MSCCCQQRARSKLARRTQDEGRPRLKRPWTKWLDLRTGKPVSEHKTLAVALVRPSNTPALGTENAPKEGRKVALKWSATTHQWCTTQLQQPTPCQTLHAR